MYIGVFQVLKSMIFGITEFQGNWIIRTSKGILIIDKINTFNTVYDYLGTIKSATQSSWNPGIPYPIGPNSGFRYL